MTTSILCSATAAQSSMIGEMNRWPSSSTWKTVILARSLRLWSTLGRRSCSSAGGGRLLDEVGDPLPGLEVGLEERRGIALEAERPEPPVLEPLHDPGLHLLVAAGLPVDQGAPAGE